jgi:hypothetical protein
MARIPRPYGLPNLPPLPQPPVRPEQTITPPIPPADIQLVKKEDLSIAFDQGLWTDDSHARKRHFIPLDENTERLHRGTIDAIRAALPDCTLNVHLEPKQDYSRGNERVVGDLLSVDENLAQLKSLSSLDLKNPALVRSFLDTAFRVADYCKVSGQSEAVCPRSFFVRGDNQVAFLPGLVSKEGWHVAVAAYLPEAVRDKKPRALSEAELCSNLVQTTFFLVHCAPATAESRARLPRSPLRKMWEKAFKETSLATLQQTLRAALVCETGKPPATKLLVAGASKRRRHLVWAVLVLTVLLLVGGTASAGGFLPFIIGVAKKLPVIKSVIDKMTGSGQSSGNGGGGAATQPASPPMTLPAWWSKLDPIPEQRFIIYKPGLLLSTTPGEPGKNRLADDLGKPLPAIPNHYVPWSPDPRTLNTLLEEIRTFAETKDVSFDASTKVWTVKNSKVWVGYVVYYLKGQSFTIEADKAGAQTKWLIFSEPREVTLACLRADEQSGGGDGILVINLEMWLEGQAWKNLTIKMYR